MSLFQSLFHLFQNLCLKIHRFCSLWKLHLTQSNKPAVGCHSRWDCSELAFSSKRELGDKQSWKESSPASSERSRDFSVCETAGSHNCDWDILSSCSVWKHSSLCRFGQRVWLADTLNEKEAVSMLCIKAERLHTKNHIQNEGFKREEAFKRNH